MKTAYLAGAIIALTPAVLLGQTRSTNTSPAPQTPSTPVQPVARTTSTGEVAGPGSDANVTAAMLAEQKDPKLIGSPAWWSTHATADGKPLSAAKR